MIDFKTTILYCNANDFSKKALALGLERGFTFILSNVSKRKVQQIPNHAKEYVKRPSEIVALAGITVRGLNVTPDSAQYENELQNNFIRQMMSDQGSDRDNAKCKLDRELRDIDHRAGMASRYSFRLKIEEVFDATLIESYDENIRAGTVSFEIRNYGSTDGVSFDKLAQVSEILGTRKINLSESSVVDPGCDTCGHGYKAVTPVHCSEVQFQVNKTT
jgi:hypothetical protein